MYIGMCVVQVVDSFIDILTDTCLIADRKKNLEMAFIGKKLRSLKVLIKVKIT